MVSGQIVLRPAEPIKNYSQAIKIMSYIPCAINDVNLCILQLFTHKSPFHCCHFFKERNHLFFFLLPQEKSDCNWNLHGRSDALPTNWILSKVGFYV